VELDRLVVPGTKIQSEIMQPTAGFKNGVLKTGFPIPDFVFDNAVTFDTANRMFNPNSHRSEPLVNVFVQVRQRLASGLLFGLQDGYVSQAKALKAAILAQFAAGGQLIITLIGQLFVMLFAFNGIGQKKDPTKQIDQDIIFDRMLFFLPL
jgi:hypothetical protein